MGGSGSHPFILTFLKQGRFFEARPSGDLKGWLPFSSPPRTSPGVDNEAWAQLLSSTMLSWHARRLCIQAQQPPAETSLGHKRPAAAATRARSHPLTNTYTSFPSTFLLSLASRPLPLPPSPPSSLARLLFFPRLPQP